MVVWGKKGLGDDNKRERETIEEMKEDSSGNVFFEVHVSMKCQIKTRELFPFFWRFFPHLFVYKDYIRLFEIDL